MYRRIGIGIGIHVCMYIYIYMYICICICVCIYIYIYIYIHIMVLVIVLLGGHRHAPGAGLPDVARLIYTSLYIGYWYVCYYLNSSYILLYCVLEYII